MYNQAPFIDRRNIGSFLSEKQKMVGAEIGTHRAEFACQLLDQWKGTLYCIDPWLPNYDPEDGTSTADRTEDYQQALQNLAPYYHRTDIIQKTSEQAAELFTEYSLDFVYVDGNHQPQHVQQDIELWWPKLKLDGYLFGHDIICPGEVNNGWGRYIQPVVEKFAATHDLTIYLIVETLCLPWSFYLHKTVEH